MSAIGVDCVTADDGVVRVRRVQISGKWHEVSQGRQWKEEDGRHVLIMFGGRDVREIVLRSETLTWELIHSPAGAGVV
jgi:hypothetical protein